MFDPQSDYFDADIAENYRRLRRERGCSWEDLARDVAPTDRDLAAWMRRQADEEQPQSSRAKAPQGRRRPDQAKG